MKEKESDNKKLERIERQAVTTAKSGLLDGAAKIFENHLPGLVAPFPRRIPTRSVGGLLARLVRKFIKG